MTDYPAAHSMDTLWFAVDRDGNVAVFETGESGAVPVDAFMDEGEVGDVHDELRSLPVTGARQDPGGHAALVRPSYEHVPADSRSTASLDGWTLLMFVRDPDAIRPLLDRLGAKEVPASTGACFSFQPRDNEAFQEIHARGACTHCQTVYGIDDQLAKHGLFQYEHTCENWIAGPYARVATPRTPITIDKLPDAVRDSAIQFDGRFTDAGATTVQPLEHWQCESWEAAWLATDGKTVRAVPGHEDEYSEQVENMRDLEEDLVFVDAPPAEPKAKVDATPPKATARTTTPEPSPQIPWWQFWRKQ